MKKRIITILMAFVMTVSFIPILGELAPEELGVVEAYAYTNHSQSEAVAWISARKAEHWAVDYDGLNGAQCVDLIEYYFDYLAGYHLTGNGYDYVGRGDLPSGWYYTSAPSPGDIAVWAKNKGIAREWGHVALVESVGGGSFNYVDVNGANHTGGSGTLSNSNPSSFIHPDFGGNPGPAVDIQESVYSIHSAINNNLVLDVADGKTTNGTNIQTQNYHGGPAQRFNIVKENGYYLIRPQCSNLLLDTAGNSDQPGANVAQWESTGAHGQHWEFVDAGDGYYYIRNWRGTYLDVSGGENSIQVNIQTWSYNGSNAQKWKLVHETRSVSEGYYSIRSTKDNNLALDIANESQKEGANLRLYNYNGSRAQVFRVKKENNSYTIHPICSGLMIDTAANSDVSGANLIQWSDTSAQGQRFKFVITGGGNYYIRSNLGRFIDITDGVFAQGTNIQSCKFFGGTAQKWKLVKEDISKFKPAMPNVTISGSNGNATISWNSVDTAYKNKYDVRIYDVNKGLNNYIKVAWGVNGTSYTTNLPAGSYGVTVAAVDKIDSNIYSNAKMIRFTIDENGKVEQEKKPDNPIDPANPGESTNQNAPSSANPVNPANGATEGASAAAVTKYLTTRQDDSDAPGSTYGKLTARVSKAGKTSQKVNWNAVPGAVKYNLYANKCGKTNKLLFLGSVTGTSFTHKGLKKGTYYKYMVVAVDKNERVAASSKVVHSATAGGKVGNFKKVKTAAKKNKVNLKTGKKFKLKAKGVKGKGKVRKHRAICYESSNPAVATVSKKGIIKGVAPGKCIVYAYAQNGVFTKVIVTIK